MSAAVISTLIFASPGASSLSARDHGAGGGSRPLRGNAVSGARAESEGVSAFSGSRTDSPVVPSGSRAGEHVQQVRDTDPSADYWHALAVKRLKIIGKRERRIVALLVRIHKLRAGRQPPPNRGLRGGSPAKIICSVFGSHCSEAITVAKCESTLNVYARNGDYEGLFQFGSFARAHYGFAWDALTQARAAYRYFLDAGWSPWQCRP